MYLNNPFFFYFDRLFYFFCILINKLFKYKRTLIKNSSFFTPYYVLHMFVCVLTMLVTRVIRMGRCWLTTERTLSLTDSVLILLSVYILMLLR